MQKRLIPTGVQRRPDALLNMVITPQGAAALGAEPGHARLVFEPDIDATVLHAQFNLVDGPGPS
jgi:hypothetical protein